MSSSSRKRAVPPSDFVAVVSHGVWQAAHEAGILPNGRRKVGGVMGAKRSKGAQDKRACRGRHADDD